MEFLEGFQVEGEINTSFLKDHEKRKTFQERKIPLRAFTGVAQKIDGASPLFE